jgi:hypothetical protein
MNHKSLQDPRILSIAPTSRGFGFAVIEGQKLIIWGNKEVATKGDNNKSEESLKKIYDLMNRWQPAILTVEDVKSKDTRRRSRIKELILRIASLARRQRVKVKSFSQSKIKETFFDDKKRTKYDLAFLLAEWFPEELADRLPQRRKLWQSEKFVMAIFEAVAFGVGCSIILEEDN